MVATANWETKLSSSSSVAVLIPSWNGKQHLEVCLDSLRRQADPGISRTVWVHENGSKDGTAEWLAEHYPEVHLLRSATNLGFATAVNQLVAAAEGHEFVALLNNDTRPTQDWLSSLVSSLRDAPKDVAAVSGLIVDWPGQRLDFAQGVMTFDGHAFQLGYRRPLKTAEIPKSGHELPFACGGNFIIRREVFLAVGGLDDSYFAYYEDVDLGWRLWAAGHRVLFCRESKIHHHSSATSDRLGQYHRGFLFERNAFLTVYKNLDAEYWDRLMPVVLLTLLSRTQTLMVEGNPGGDTLALDPYAGLIADTGLQEAVVPTAHEAILSKLRRHGWRGSWKKLRLYVGRALIGAEGSGVALDDPQSVAQLRVLSSLLANIDRAADSRAQIQARRKLPDREFFERFPLYVVPTYLGDERLFTTSGFRSWFPEDLPTIEAQLPDLMQWP